MKRPTVVVATAAVASAWALDLATDAPQLLFDAPWLIVLLLGAAEARGLAPSAAYGLAGSSSS